MHAVLRSSNQAKRAAPLPVTDRAAAGAMPILGRDRELAVLYERLAGAAAGFGQIAMLEGEGGIGKTRLVDELLGEALSTGFATHWGHAEALERTRPFAPLVEAFACHPHSSHETRARIGRWVTGPSQASEFQVVEQFVALGEELATQGPLVVAIEDLHWSDPSTVRALRSLGRRLARSPVLVVLSFRSAPRSAELAELIARFAAEGAAHVVLGPVDQLTARTIAETYLGAVPGPKLLQHLGRADGNPLFIKELATSLVNERCIAIKAGEAELSEPVLPPSLRRSVLTGLAPLAPSTVNLLRSASLLGTSFALKDLSMVLDRRASELMAPLGEAMRYGVVVEAGERLAFRHDLVRDAIYEDTAADVRRALHYEFALALGRCGAPATQVAEQYSRGADVGDRTAVTWLREAARQHAERAPAVAVDLLRRAMQLVPAGSPEHDDVVIDLLRPLTDRGALGEAEDLASDILSRPHAPSFLTRTYRLLAHARHLRGDFSGARAAIEQALSTADVSDHDRASLLAELIDFAGSDDEHDLLCAAALTAAERANNEFARVRALFRRATTTVPVADADGPITTAVDAARALATGSHRDSEALYLLGYSLVMRAWIRSVLDRFPEAEHDLREALRLAEQVGGVAHIPAVYGEIVKLLWTTGNWQDALAEVTTAAELCDEIGVATQMSGMLATSALIHVHSDEVDVAESMVSRALRLPAPTSDPLGYRLLLARASVHESQSNWEEALELRQQVPALPSNLPDQADLVRLALALHRPDVAQSTTEAVEGQATLTELPIARATLLQCRGLVDDDADVLLQAVAAYRTCGRPLPLACACEDTARSAHRAGRIALAQEQANEAVQAFETLGAKRGAARARALLRQLGVRSGARGKRPRSTMGWESLTPTELRVVHLVKEGLTNARIGDRMFVSPRTVSTHLTHIFAKLELSTRAELIAEASKRPDDA